VSFDLPQIAMPALIFIGVLGLIIGAYFGGWGRGIWPPRD
jgi:hypothetical protein